ncbi:MAG TPA: hypothetical protein VKY59_09965 [Spirillospora sp.]|nr:hypothetical protein [Spirillospora sp.]
MRANQVLRQRHWTEEELRASKLRYYAPGKKLIMARVLDVTMDVKTTIEVLSASKGDIMVYDPEDGKKQPRIEDYDHWPVQRDLFRKTYKPWDEVQWRPNEAEAHLIMHGCRPYYKHTGVWAMRLEQPVWIQSLESPTPVQVPPGRWLVIGSEGEPYHMSDEKFRERYIIPDDED